MFIFETFWRKWKVNATHLFKISASLSGCTCKFVNFAYRWLHRCYNGSVFTGANTIPPLGLDNAMLSFNHTNPYPAASTCGLWLSLPTMYSKDYMNLLHVCSAQPWRFWTILAVKLLPYHFCQAVSLFTLPHFVLCIQIKEIMIQHCFEYNSHMQFNIATFCLPQSPL